MRFEGADRFLNSLAAIDVDQLGASDLADGIRQLALIQDQVMFQSSRYAARFDRLGAYQAYGASSTVAWLKQNAGLFGGAAHERVQVGRNLSKLKATAAALKQGEISFANAGVITRAALDVRPEAAAELEKRTLPEARRLDPRSLSNLTDKVKCELNRRDFLAELNRAHERRRMDVSQYVDGMFHIDGALDHEGGSILNRALELAVGPRTKDDYRTPSQRRADGLIDLARNFLDGTGEHQPSPMTVVVPLATLSDEKAAAPGLLDGLTPVPRETVERCLCDSAITVVVVGEAGQVMAASRTRRTVTPKERKVITSKHPTCAVPACDRPAHACDIHHLVAWADGGETSIGNSVPICRYHHRLLHEGGWRLEARADRSVELVPPTERARGPGKAAA